MLLVVNDTNATTGFGLGEGRMHSKVFENEFLAIKFDGNKPQPKPAVSVFNKESVKLYKYIYQFKALLHFL